MILANAIKFCRCTSEFNGKGADRLCIIEEAEETRRAACQNLGGKDLLEFLECYIGPHISMQIFLQLSMTEWKPVTPIKALQLTSAETDLEGDSSTFCWSHGSTQKNKKKKVTLFMGPAGRGRILALDTCHKSSCLQCYQQRISSISPGKHFI